MTVVEVDLATLDDGLLRAPAYRVVHRQAWLGTPHSALYGELYAQAEHWRASYVVVDATGIGAGLASFLARSLGRSRLIPFVFNQASKSSLGWDFLGVVDSGRFKDYASDESFRDLFLTQCTLCRYEVLPGPGKTLRWGVPDGQRHPQSGQPVHDDLLLSAALCAVLDGQEWSRGEAVSEVVEGYDPLQDMGW